MISSWIKSYHFALVSWIYHPINLRFEISLHFYNFDRFHHQRLGSVLWNFTPNRANWILFLQDYFAQSLTTFWIFFTKIFNLSLESGQFVEHWKCAVLCPLIKGKNIPTIHQNYRPVSNLSFLSKVLEKIALSQVFDHCHQHDPLPPHQSAYREGYSCETVLAKILDKSGQHCFWISQQLLILWTMEFSTTLCVTVMEFMAHVFNGWTPTYAQDHFGSPIVIE